MKESEIQSNIIDYLQLMENQGKLFFQRTNNTPVFDPRTKKFRSLAKGQKKGFPDILVLMQGRTIGLEVKTDIGKQSKEQKEIEKQFKKQRAWYYVVRSVDEVVRIIEAENTRVAIQTTLNDCDVEWW